MTREETSQRKKLLARRTQARATIAHLKEERRNLIAELNKQKNIINCKYQYKISRQVEKESMLTMELYPL